MQFGDFLALAGILFSAAIFYWLARIAKPSSIDYNEYLLAGRRVTARQYGATFVSASSSLATVFIFFIVQFQTFGLSLLICGITYLIGAFAFLKWFASSGIQTSEMTSLADLWYGRTRDRYVSKIITWLTAISFLTILFIETYIGSEVLSYYLRRFIGNWAGSLSYFAIGGFVILYVRLGGQRAVVNTDLWQHRLMVVGIIAMLLAAILSNKATAIATPKLNLPATSDLVWFYSWITLVNFTLPFTQLSSWQRIASTPSVETAMKGFKKEIWAFLLIWWGPVIALAILFSKGWSFASMSVFFDTLKAQGGVTEGLLYPFIVVGFASALFSTADTALISLQMALADEHGFGPKIKKVEESKLRRLIIFGSTLIFAVLGIIYMLAQAQLGTWFMPLVFMLFSQLSILAPPLMYALWHRRNNRTITPWSTGRVAALVLSIGIAWVILLLGAIGSALKLINIPHAQEISTWVAILVTAIGLLIALSLNGKATNPPKATNKGDDSREPKP